MEVITVVFIFFFPRKNIVYKTVLFQIGREKVYENIDSMPKSRDARALRVRGNNCR